MALNTTALIVFVALFGLVTYMGFAASRWKKADLDQLHEWGLGGRRFGTLLIWFLIGGDLYTAYTFIAVPAGLFGAGALFFFAVPYTIMVYPLVYLVFPRLWSVAHKHGYVTSADFVRGRYGNKWLALVVALTGLLATMPYIALQLVGIQVVIGAMGVETSGFFGDLPLIIAFVILAAFTYSSGLRAPAMIAIVKDALIYLTMFAILIAVPMKLGGYSAIFAAIPAPKLLLAVPPAGSGGAFSAYATLALGSALALFLYPHSITGVLSSSTADTVRKNAILLPIYTILLGLIALLGYMAIAAGIKLDKPTGVIPALFNKVFPEWFVGFSFAAIAIGALVPAAVMSIGAANLCTRNIWRPFIQKDISPTEESNIAKIVSLVVKMGALVFIVFLPTQYAIDLQLLGGIWILQVFPAVVFGLYRTHLQAKALLAGWFVGMTIGTWLAEAMQLKPVFPLQIGGQTYIVYIGLIALSANVVISFAGSWVSNAFSLHRS